MIIWATVLSLITDWYLKEINVLSIFPEFAFCQGDT